MRAEDLAEQKRREEVHLKEMQDKDLQFEASQKQINELKLVVESLRDSIELIKKNQSQESKEKVEQLESEVKQQRAIVEGLRQKVPIVQATVVHSSSSTDLATSQSIDASWQLADPKLTVAGVLLNEQQEHVFLPGTTYSGGESGVAEESNIVDFGDSFGSHHDISPGSPKNPEAEISSPIAEPDTTPPRSPRSASSTARRMYNAIVGKRSPSAKSTNLVFYSCSE